MFRNSAQELILLLLLLLDDAILNWCIMHDPYLAAAEEEEEEEDKGQWVLKLWTWLQLHLAVCASDFHILIDRNRKA